MKTKRHAGKVVDPSTLEVGDKVRYRAPSNKGVSVTVEGRVGSVLAQGMRRQVLTPEGGRLFAWYIDKKVGECILLEAAPVGLDRIFGNEFWNE